MKRLAFLLALTGCGLTPTQVASDIAKGVDVGVCIIAQIESGTTDPIQLLDLCAKGVPGASERLVIQAVDRHTAEASTEAIDAVQLKFLSSARTNAVVSLANKATSK